METLGAWLPGQVNDFCRRGRGLIERSHLVFAAPEKQGHIRTLRDCVSSDLIGAAFTGEPKSCFAPESVRNPVDFTWAMRAVRGNQR
jgi:hypothetical protein